MLPSLDAGLLGLSIPFAFAFPFGEPIREPTPFAVPLGCDFDSSQTTPSVAPSVFGGWLERGFVFWRARVGREVWLLSFGVEGGGGVGSRAGGGMSVPSVREEVGRERSRRKVLRRGSRAVILLYPFLSSALERVRGAGKLIGEVNWKVKSLVRLKMRADVGGWSWEVRPSSSILSIETNLGSLSSIVDTCIYPSVSIKRATCLSLLFLSLFHVS